MSRENNRYTVRPGRAADAAELARLVESVGTAPEHRGNRLTDRLFAALHQRYAVDGVPLQVIEGRGGTRSPDAARRLVAVLVRETEVRGCLHSEQFLTAAFPQVPVRVWPCN